MRRLALACSLCLSSACSSEADPVDGSSSTSGSETESDEGSESSTSSDESTSESESAGDGDGDEAEPGDGDAGDGDGDGEMAWQGAEALEMLGLHAAAQALVAGPDGGALGLWQQNDALGVRQLYGAFFDASSGTWQAPQVVYGGTESVGTARGRVDAQGNAWVAWIQSTGGADSLILASHYDASTQSWSAPETLADDGLAHTGLSVVIDGEGHPHVSWVGYNPIGVFIEYELRSRRAVDGQWGTASALELTPDLVRSPSVTIDAQGRPVAAWAGENLMGVSEIHLARFDLGTESWSLETQLPTPLDEDASQVKLRVAQNGSEWLLFRAGLGSYNDLTIVHREGPASLFGTPEVLDVGDARPESSALAVADDFAFVIWTQDDGSDHFPVFARHYSVSGGQWSSALVLDPNPELDTPASFSLGTNPAGQAVVVYQVAPVDTADDCQAKHFSPSTQSWGDPQALERSEHDADSPFVIVDELGRAIAMWDQDDGDEVDSMWANRYE